MRTAAKSKTTIDIVVIGACLHYSRSYPDKQKPNDFPGNDAMSAFGHQKGNIKQNTLAFVMFVTFKCRHFFCINNKITVD